MKKIMFLFLAVLILLTSTTAFAASPWTTASTNKDKMLGKLDFGFKNLLGGWTELFAQPYYAVRDKQCVIRATFKGLITGAIDEVGGALHVLTFPLTSVDVPLPNNGALNGPNPCGCCGLGKKK